MTEETNKASGADLLPETPIYMLAVDGSHIHFTDGSGSTAEQMIAAVTMIRPGAKCEVTWLYTEQMLIAYRSAAVSALIAERDELLESAKFLLSLQQLRSRKTDEIRAIIAKTEAKP